MICMRESKFSHDYSMANLFNDNQQSENRNLRMFKYCRQFKIIWKYANLYRSTFAAKF